MSKNKIRNYLFSSFKLILSAVLLLLFFISCNDEKQSDVTAAEIVEKPEDIDEAAKDIIRRTISEIIGNDPVLPDSFRVKNAEWLRQLYDDQDFRPFWSAQGAFSPHADSLVSLLGNSRRFGLFPEDYYLPKLVSIREKVAADTGATRKLDASLWAYHDLMLTSAFVQVIRDVKLGRLLPDSMLRKDTIVHIGLLRAELDSFRSHPSRGLLEKFEPVHQDYLKLKKSLAHFLDSADLRKYTYVSASGKDSSLLRKLVYKRISEEDSLHLEQNPQPDSLQIAAAIKKYQKFYKMKADGKISTALVARLNNTGLEKFIRVAINMDRYKQLSPLPKQYLWVNMAGYYLEMRDSDTVALRSKIVVGKPKTRTPVITSAINNMITYPQWHIPESIIKQEILPGLKKDAGYTKKKGYSILDKDGNEVDPYSVDWSKYKTGIPYRVIQGSGDDNALGILKFNFPNTHSVYLHDTNQRYLFSRSSRALSHGCVRVQAWNELARFILKNDSLHSANAIPADSLQSWLSQKKKQYIPVRKPIPLYIRYFTCDAKEEGLVFYEDIYGEDKKFRDRIFTTK